MTQSFPSKDLMHSIQPRVKQRNLAYKEFVRDVKKHIEDIANKYILPHEGTIDYALMYIPSEAVYYEIMSNLPELSDYSYKKGFYQFPRQLFTLL